jgi:F-type H+-transporting ATPase subunit b
VLLDVLSGAQTAVVAAEPAASAGLPQFDLSWFASQVFWLALSFGLLYWLVSKVFAPGITDVMDARDKRIADDLANARRLNDEAQAAAAEHEKAVGAARTAARSLAAETRARLAAESQREREALEADLAARLAAAEDRIARSREANTHAAREAAVDTARAIVARIADVTVSDEAAERAVGLVRGEPA